MVLLIALEVSFFEWLRYYQELQYLPDDYHFWKILKSLREIKSTRLHDDGLYAGLLIRLIAYVFLIRLKLTKSFFNSLLQR
jgi:hypothetical protein